MPIRLLALSDIHGKISSLNAILDRINESDRVDLVTISGDISNFGDASEVRHVLKPIEERGMPFYYVLGNCDPEGARDGVDVAGTCLESRCGQSSGVTVTGAGGSTPTPFGTTFERPEEEICESILMNLALCSRGLGILMLLVHNPPLGEVVDRTSLGRHVGSRKLRELVISVSPRLVQCGHIHEAAGLEKIGSTLVFNPGPAMRGNYAIAEIGEGTVNVVLGKA